MGTERQWLCRFFGDFQILKCQLNTTWLQRAVCPNARQPNPHGLREPIHLVNAEGGYVVQNAAVGTSARRFAATSDGRELWVSSELSGKIHIITSLVITKSIGLTSILHSRREKLYLSSDRFSLIAKVLGFNAANSRPKTFASPLSRGMTLKWLFRYTCGCLFLATTATASPCRSRGGRGLCLLPDFSADDHGTQRVHPL
jgi:hypothetical protein